jgi:hypothetical protein
MHFLLSALTDSYTSTNGGSAGLSIGGGIVGYIFSVIVYWRIFTKAGRSGWLALIPIVNTIVLIQITGHSGVTVLLLLIPLVNLAWSIVIAIHLGQSFNKGAGFSFFLLWLLAPIGYLILAFGGSTYHDERSNPAV